MNRMLNAMVAITLAVTAHTVFAEDPYIESDGTQAINTGYYMNGKTKIVIDFQQTEMVNQMRLFGQNGRGNYAQVYSGDSNANLKFGYGNASFSGVFIVKNNLNRNTIIYDGPHNVGYLIQNGVTNATVQLTAAHDGTSTLPMAIFADAPSSDNGAKGLSFENLAKMRLFGFQIYEDDVLVHNYIPAKRNGLFGLYDTETKVFLKDNRQGASAKLFTGSANVPDVGDAAYIENFGQRLVNAGCYKTPHMRFEIDFALTEKPPKPAEGKAQQQWRIAGQDSTGRPLSMYTNGGNNFSFGQGDAFLAFSTSIPIDLNRHQMIADLEAKKCYFTTGEFGAATTNWTADISDGNKYTNTLTATRPMALMGYMSNDKGMTMTVDVAAAKAKYYRCRVFESNVLIHDYMPCVKGGVPGFRDHVTGEFVTVEYKTDCEGICAGGDVEQIPDDGYIEATGIKQYIDTGYKAKSSTRIVADFALTTNACNTAYDGMPAISQPWVYGHYDDQISFGSYVSGGAMHAWLCSTNNVKNVFYGSGVSVTHRRRQMVVDADQGRLSFLTAGFTNEWHAVPVPTGRTNERTLAIFTRRSASGFETFYPYAKLYGLQIYESGELVRNFKPYIQNGKVGLKDALTGTFVTSASAPLKCGGAIEGADMRGAYIESDGTQAMTTLYKPNPNTKVEVTYAFTEIVGQDRVFCEVNNQSMELYIQGSSKGSGNVAFIYGNPLTTIGAITTANFLRQTAMIDFYNKKYSITGGSSGNLDSSKIPADKTAGHPIALFGKANNAAGTAFAKNSNSSLYTRMKLYSMKIYEKDVLLHHYLPYKDGDLVCLKDVVTGDLVQNAVTGAKPFKIGGLGWNDDGDVFYTQPQGGVTVEQENTTTLSAYAPGAIGYQWYKDGEALEGETGMQLVVPWQRRPRTATYTVQATFDQNGVPATRESAPATVNFRPFGLIIIFK